jgi:negative regulator of flagellin synthesis FlgM
LKINDISGIPGLYGPQAAKKTGTKKAGAAAREDKVELSQEAREAMALRSKVDAVPEVRSEKIRSLQQAISSGTYRPDAREVATKMIKSKVFNGLA